jgi:hypothetical protein
MRTAVNALREHDLQQDDDALIKRLIAPATVVPLEVELDRANPPDVHDIQMQIKDYGHTVTVPGFRVSRALPFKGEPELWYLQPSTFTSPPRGEVRGQWLIVGIELPTQRANEAKRYLDETVGLISQYVVWQRGQIERHNSGLVEVAHSLLQQRRAHVAKAAELRQSLIS